MSSDDDIDRSQAGRNWVTTLHESRTNCREKVAEAMVSVPEPTKVLWPVRQRSQMTGAQKAAIEGHVSVIDFADQVLPYRGERGLDEEIWEKELVEVERLEGLTVSLDTLDEWEFQFMVNEKRTEDELYGESVEKERYRVLLPVTGMRACYRQLNKITKELGFAADANAGGQPKTGIDTPEPGQ